MRKSWAGEAVVFPNPVRAGEVLVVERNGDWTAGEVRLVDVLGRTVARASVNVDATRVVLPTEGLATGTYYVDGVGERIEVVVW